MVNVQPVMEVIPSRPQRAKNMPHPDFMTVLLGWPSQLLRKWTPYNNTKAVQFAPAGDIRRLSVTVPTRNVVTRMVGHPVKVNTLDCSMARHMPMLASCQ